METVDYGDTSEEDTTDQPNTSTAQISHNPSPPNVITTIQTLQNPNPDPLPKPMSQGDIINANLDNLASLIPILQSHQQLIEAESNSIQHNKKPSKPSKKSKKSHSSNNTTILPSNPTLNNTNIIQSSMNIPPPITTSLDNPESIAYFILRSNNEENVRTSMEKGVWATQPQNEPILNEAFEKFEKVILFFSVCRSMHFQGLAQMTSRIGHHKSRSLWEIDPHARTRGKTKWGGTFTVTWLRIFDLAFDQTNNICNPWNGNRPVKFSRDGQAVPFRVGQQLTHLFDIGVMEFGQGSAILRKPIRIGDTNLNIIAVQKVFVNGRFIPATDIQTAQNMIALEQQQIIKNNNNNNQNNSHTNHTMHNNNNNNNNSNNNNNNEAANALNRLVNSLQNQSETNVIGNININNANNLLNIANLLNNDLNVNHKKVNKQHKNNRDRNRKRYRKRDRERDSNRNRDRSRDRHRAGDNDRKSRKDRRDRHRHRHRDRDRKKSHGKHGNGNGNGSGTGGGDKRRSEQEVINSLWTQINLQQALLAQSGLYNALNVNSDVGTNNITTTAPPPTYPSNRGGVY